MCRHNDPSVSDLDFVSANGKVKDWEPGREAGARWNVKERGGGA